MQKKKGGKMRRRTKQRVTKVENYLGISDGDMTYETSAIET